jgi:branched-chain amino acid transport system substrate-binding protein
VLFSEEEVQSNPSPRVSFSLVTLTLLGVVIWLVSCNQTVSPSLVTPTPISLVPPITVEVTRIVERLVVATPAPAACSRGQLASATEVVIGALAPLSRPGSILAGFAMQTAFTLAVDDINTAGGIGGKPVRLVTYDGANSPERGALYSERLATLDCASILVGVYHSPVAVAVKEVAHRYGLPVIFTSAAADELTTSQYPEVFRISPTMSMLAQMPGKWLAEVGDFNHDGDNFAILIAENAAESQVMLEQVQQWLRTYQIRFETIAVDLPTTDFSSVIARIVALERVPDAVFINISGEAAFDLQQQMLNARIGPEQSTLIVSNVSAQNDQTFWHRVPNGVFTVVPKMGPWPSTVPALGTHFAERYRTYFDRWPEASAFAAYDAIRLAADAIRRSNSLVPADIIAALEASDIDLASGHYTFPYNSTNPPDGKETPAYLWHQWPDAPLLYFQYGAVNQPASAAPVIWPTAYRTIDTAVLRPGERQ